MGGSGGAEELGFDKCLLSNFEVWCGHSFSGSVRQQLLPLVLDEVCLGSL